MTQMNELNQEQLFTNGTIYIDAERKVKNIVVKNGLVEAVDVDPAKYANAKVVDLKGSVAYPGFCDSHVHVVEVGITNGGVNLTGCSTSDDIAKALAVAIKKRGTKDLLVGAGFYPKDYAAWSLDDLSIIDKATGDIPVMLVDKLGHNCVINSVAIKICKLSTKSTLPMGGNIIFQDDKPTGMLRESAMTIAGDALFPLISDDIIRDGAQKLLNMWSAMGYTGVVDLMGGPMGRILKADICREMENDGSLNVRVNYMYTFSSLDELDNLEDFKKDDTEMVRYGGLKIFIDGAYAGGEAWTKEKNSLGNNGLYYVYTDDSFGKQYNINRIIEKVNELGINTHYHTQGDEAIGAVLDALDLAIEKKGHLTSIHTLVHIAFPTKDQIKRIKNFNGQVLATMQPGFWVAERGTDKYYGEKANSCYPIKEFFDAGISTGMSTDFSVSPLNLSAPTTIMGVGMTGAGDPDNHPPITMKNVIHGLTVGSAATTPKQDTGMLDVGYKADMVVYGKDLYSIPKEELTNDNPKVLSTWVGGRMVYEAK